MKEQLFRLDRSGVTISHKLLVPGITIIFLPPVLNSVKKLLTKTWGRFPATSDEDFTTWGSYLVKWIATYRSTCRKIPVISRVAPNYLRDALPEAAPEVAEPWEDVVGDLDKLIVPGLTNWEASNKFFAYFKPHASYPAVLGELVCAGLNVMGFDWIASPACTELEVVTMDWLGKFLNLPSQFLHSSEGPGGGVIQGSAGESATVVILAAIIKAIKKSPLLRRHEMCVVCSDQTHAIVQKATMILGCQFRSVKTTIAEEYALNVGDLERELDHASEDGLTTVAVVATTGTTSSCAFDPIDEIGRLCKLREIGWLHIDAAYGGAYACLEEYREKFKGLELADSFCVNCHKKLLCPFDLAALYVADRNPILDALSLQPEYLRNSASDSGAVVDFEHWQMPLGRRFRSLKLWFVMRRFGTQGLKFHVQNGVKLAEHFAELVRRDDDLELVVEPSLSLVCFRWANRGEEDQQSLLDAIKATGDCFLIHTKLEGRIAIRLAAGGIEQQESDIEGAYRVIKKCIASLS